MGAGSSAQARPKAFGATGLKVDTLHKLLEKAGAKWDKPRVDSLFRVLDKNGDGRLEEAEFMGAIADLFAVLKSLLAQPLPSADTVTALEAENAALRMQNAALSNKRTPAETRTKQKQASHEAAMPPLLRAFTPLSEIEDVSTALVELEPLEEAVRADPDRASAQDALRAGLDRAAAMILPVIEKRLDEEGMVPSCDAVIATGIDFFVDMYNETFDTIRKSEAVDGYEEHAQRLQSCAEASSERLSALLQKSGAKPTAMQKHRDVTSLCAEALCALPHFAQLLEKVKAKVPGLGSHEHPVEPGSLKRVSRIQEKALLRRDDEGNADRICDVVRALLVVSSMEQFSAVLKAIFDVHTEQHALVVRVKDRIKSPMGGWRDVMVNLLVSTPEAGWHVCEIQVAHQKMLAAREGLDGHAIYNRVRNASELLEKRGVGGKLGRIEQTVVALREALAANDLAKTWASLARAGDASALSGEAIKAAAETEGDVDWLRIATERLVVESASSVDAFNATGLLDVLRSAQIPVRPSPDGFELPVGVLLGTEPTSSLNCRGAKLAARSAVLIASCIQGNAVLEDLILADCGISDVIVVPFAQALKVNAKLTSVDLRHNRIGFKGWTALCEGLQMSATVRSCNLLGNPITVAGAQQLQELAAAKRITFAGIADDQADASFKGQGLSPIDSVIIASDVSLSHHLKILNLRDNEIGDMAGASAIAAALGGNKSLTTLDLTNTRIGAVGAEKIAAALQANEHLASLHLDGIDLPILQLKGTDPKARASIAVEGDKDTLDEKGFSSKPQFAAAVVIAKCVELNRTVTELKLRGVYVGSAGGVAFGRLLANNHPSLTHLALDDCGIGVDDRNNTRDQNSEKGFAYDDSPDTAFIAIAEGLKSNTTLRVLNLSENHIHEKGMLALAEALPFSSLAYLHPGEAETNTRKHFTSKGVKALNKAGIARKKLGEETGAFEFSDKGTRHVAKAETGCGSRH